MLLLLPACSPGGAAPGAGTPPHEAGAVVERVACEGLELSLLAAPPTREGLRAAFGQPDSIAVTTEPNRHVENVTDSLFVVRYPGLLVSMRKPGGGNDMADHVEITDGRFVRYPWLAPGALAETVLTSLGEPTERGAASMTYDCNLGADQPVTFHMHAGRVTSVTIDYYVD